MTFYNDFMRLNFHVVGPKNAPLRQMELSWPPPERIYLERGATIREARDGDDPDFVMVRVSYSEITDEQRAEMTHVCRGAEYYYLSDLEPTDA